MDKIKFCNVSQKKGIYSRAVLIKYKRERDAYFGDESD